MTDLLLSGIGELVTNVGEPIMGAAVAIDGDKISYAGPEADAPELGSGAHHDCRGGTVLPGFVDAHTHLVFAGDRSREFARRLSGTPYAAIAAEGGGILSTVSATRSTGENELYELAAARAWRMIRAGTTTMEVKSGYGLDVESELRILRVARKLGEDLPITVKTTFLGAHSIPAEFKDDRQGYIDLLIEEMLPAASGLADYCDVFVEEGVFTTDEARRIFAAASQHGMTARVHAEQLSHSGGARLAAEIGAVSADHLDCVTAEDAELLARAGVSAVLVPGASYTLGSPQAPARLLLESGCNVALATDCNPGTSYFEAMGPVISLGVVQMGLTVPEAIYAATKGGAISLGLFDRGVIEPGMRADLIVLDAPSADHIPYRPATNLVTTTISGGMRLQ